MPLSPDGQPGDAPLLRFERVGLWLLLLAIIGFGGLVLVRSALQRDRKTDLGVYLRAAYAVRTGVDIYDESVCDNNGWHFCYPPPFAILMTPLADPNRWEGRAGYLPYWLSVIVWYALTVWLTWAAADRFARSALPDARPGSRRWWYARLVPLYVSAAGVGFTLARGQVNSLVVWLIAGVFAAAVAQTPLRAGGWLAAAVALKVIPAYLGLFLVTDLPGRAVRGVLGLGIGLVVWLVVFPAAVWGWDKMVDTNRTFVDVVLAPGALGTGDQTRARELTDTTATDSQSFQAMLHNLRHPDPTARPDKADGRTRLAHWGIGAALSLATVWVGWRRRVWKAPPDRLVYLGCLTALMLLLSPASHMHYYLYGLPLVAGLWLRGLAERPGAAFADRRTTAVLAGWGGGVLALLLPGRTAEIAREVGVGVAITVGLWAYGLVAIGRATSASAGPAAPTGTGRH